MAKKTRKQQERDAYEKLLKKALEPFKPQRSMDDVLRHEEEIREKSIKAIHEMKNDISESEKSSIKARADFEKTF